jgi:hypothetical protein
MLFEIQIITRKIDQPIPKRICYGSKGDFWLLVQQITPCLFEFSRN